MQITDLNNSLLKAMTTGEGKKQSSASESFADMIKTASAKPEVKSVTAGKDDVAADYQQQTSSVEVKTADKTANRSASADEAKPEPKEKPAKNQSQSKKTSKDDTQADNTVVSDNKAAQPQAQKNMPTENPDEAVVTPVVDENGDMVAEIVEPVVGYVTMPVLEVEPVAVSVEPENVVPVVIAEENVVPQMSENAQPAEVVVPSVTPVVADENIEQPQAMVQEDAPIEAEVVAAPTVAKQVLPTDNQVEILPEEVIAAQEEKIAELLPEDTAVAVKVSVKEDKVTDSLTDKPLTPLFDEVVEVEPTAIQDDMSEVQPEVKVEPQKAETSVQPQAAVLNMAEDVANVEVKTQAEVAVTRVESAALSSSQTFVAGEGARSMNAVNQNTAADTSFKDAYDKGLTREVAEQIKVNITQSAIKGVDKIEIQLKPAELGHLEIKMQISKDGRLQAHIVASDANTMELLQKDLSALKQAFDNAGFQTEDGSFSFSYRGDEQNNNERERLRTFIGEVITQDVAEETAANDYIGVDGVNIRV